uniref:Uncharacterized protein n=1 Tax=Cacopsylla melanoneura TaxID=428564 RepID=A0A8D8RVC3_9HEMI
MFFNNTFFPAEYIINVVFYRHFASPGTYCMCVSLSVCVCLVWCVSHSQHHTRRTSSITIALDTYNVNNQIPIYSYIPTYTTDRIDIITADTHFTPGEKVT